jgi:transcriptional regulator with XRE-family HTH domain
MGYSAESFAGTLGITRAALYKYLGEQAIPSLRVLEKARRLWKVRLNYGELGEDYLTKKRTVPSGQMEFKFTTADISEDRITIRKVVARDTSVEMTVRIDLAKGA